MLTSNAVWAAPAGEYCRNTTVITALLYPFVRLFLHAPGAGHSLPSQKHWQGYPRTGLGTAVSVWALRGTCRIQHVLTALQVCKTSGTGRKQDTLLGIAGKEPQSGCFSRVRLTKSFTFKNKWIQKCGTCREVAKCIFIGGRKEKKKSQASMTPVFLPNTHSLQLFKYE